MSRPTGGDVAELTEILSAQLLVPPGPGRASWQSACVVGAISEALREAGLGCALVLPLGNLQVIRSASLLGAVAVVVCAGQPLEPEAIALAGRERIALLATKLDLRTCRELLSTPIVKYFTGDSPAGLAAKNGLQTEAVFPVLGGAYFMAGYASQRVRQLLEELGVAAELVRRVSIAAYEAEMNVCIYARSGTVAVRVTPEAVELCVADSGPGIADLELALKPGYSTAPPRARELGFGAGMGLPNIARCCDELSVQSSPELGGARLEMRFLRSKRAVGETSDDLAQTG